MTFSETRTKIKNFLKNCSVNLTNVKILNGSGEDLTNSVGFVGYFIGYKLEVIIGELITKRRDDVTGGSSDKTLQSQSDDRSDLVRDNACQK